jgi:hypothetical protein
VPYDPCDDYPCDAYAEWSAAVDDALPTQNDDAKTVDLSDPPRTHGIYADPELGSCAW